MKGLFSEHKNTGPFKFLFHSYLFVFSESLSLTKRKEFTGSFSSPCGMLIGRKLFSMINWTYERSLLCAPLFSQARLPTVSRFLENIGVKECICAGHHWIEVSLISQINSIRSKNPGKILSSDTTAMIPSIFCSFHSDLVFLEMCGFTV